MLCGSCGFENPSSSRHCGNCGALLQSVCYSCGNNNPSDFKYCGNCGKLLQPKWPGLSTAGEQADTATGQKDRLDAERRQLTVMFCDLVGSTSLAERLDPEDLRIVLQDYQHVCVDAVNRYEGHVAKYLGDGVLIYFGYPQAHEEDPIRAAKTGLTILKAISHLGRRVLKTHGVEVRARIGVHTGLVVAGDMGDTSQFEAMAIVGETPNIAARLEAFAEPGTMVVSAATERLVKGYFETVDLGAHTLKGVSRPVEIFRIIGEGAARNRLDVSAVTGLTPLVGRDVAVDQLRRLWRIAMEGRGRSILLTGEAGLGKSRLVQTIKEEIDLAESGRPVELRCSPFYKNSAFWPIIDLIEHSILAFERDDHAERKLARIKDYVNQMGLDEQDSVPLLASLLSVPTGPEYPPLELNPTRQKQRILELLFGLMLVRAAQQPVLFVVEDLHWADPSTLELLSIIVGRIALHPIMAVFTARPDFDASAFGEAPLELLRIERLQLEACREMIKLLAAGLPSEVVNQLIAKGDGVPLYMEEMTRMVIESGQVELQGGEYLLTAPAPTLSIPTSLQDSLMARLDRLSTAKTVAQVGATLGREFSYELLRSVAPGADAAILTDLRHLVTAGILIQRGEKSRSSYRFKHALIQDAAYNSLLKSTRQQYHRRAAEAMLEGFCAEVQTNPELVAHHLTEAGEIAESLPYWLSAGQRAVQRSANLEAIAHLTQGLDLLKSLSQGAERDQQELMLLTALGPALIAARGFGDSQVGDTYGRARQLCGQAEESLQHFFVQWGLFAFYILRAELDTSEHICNQMMAFAKRDNNPEHLLMAHICLAANQFFQAKFELALENARAAFSYYDFENHRLLASVYGQDSGVVSLTYVGLSLLFLGYPDQAMDTLRGAIALGEKVGFMFTLVQARVYADVALLYLRQWTQALPLIERHLAQATEQVFPLWMAHSMMDGGICRANLGDPAGGIEQLRKGLALWERTGAALALSSFRAYLAELEGNAGHVESAQAMLPEVFDHVHRSGEAFMEADLHRIQGELFLNAQRPDLAEASYRSAISLARNQSNRLIELRSVVSLCRVLEDQGRAEEMRELLEPLCSWFTEGLEMPDLVEAKEMLAHARS